ncbi:hypothetical protein HDU76_002664 [Blyttiomyces sp. JEL0837]|nr:hypothetical protein HDU76_002664 [Blyttiomyces sp. JEL0837]
MPLIEELDPTETANFKEGIFKADQKVKPKLAGDPHAVLSNFYNTEGIYDQEEDDDDEDDEEEELDDEEEDEVEDDDDDDDRMEETDDDEEVTRGRGRTPARNVIESDADDEGDEESDVDSDGMPDLVDMVAPGEAKSAAGGTGAKKQYPKNVTMEDDEDSDDMPDLADDVPGLEGGNNWSGNYSKRSVPTPQEKADRDDVKECCSMQYFHDLNICQHPDVYELRSALTRRLDLSRQHTVATNAALAAETELIKKRKAAEAAEREAERDAGRRRSSSVGKRESFKFAQDTDKVDELWEKVAGIDSERRELNEMIKNLDTALCGQIRRSHDKLSVKYGRSKSGKLFDRNDQTARYKNARSQARRNKKDWKGYMGDTADAQRLMEIDQARRILSNKKQRHLYLAYSDDSKFLKTRRTPIYGDADLSDEEEQKLLEEPIWKIQRRERVGGLARRSAGGTLPNRVIIQEYPAQPTCPIVEVEDSYLARKFKISWTCAYAQDRKVSSYELSVRANGSMWEAVYTGHNTSCTLQLDMSGNMSFRVRALNNLGWGVYSMGRDIDVPQWKPKKDERKQDAWSRKKRPTPAAAKSDASPPKESFDALEEEDKLTISLRQRFKGIMASGTVPSRLEELRNLRSEADAHKAVVSSHFIKDLQNAISTAEAQIRKDTKELTSQWRTKLSAMTQSLLKTPDHGPDAVAMSSTSDFSDLIESLGSSNDLSHQIRNQISQAVVGVMMKRPTKLAPVIAKNGMSAMTPGLPALRKVRGLMEVYLEACVKGQLLNPGGIQVARDWVTTVSSEITRAVVKQEERFAAFKEEETERIERARIAKEERERKELARLEMERKRREEAEAKEAILIAARIEREAREEEERKKREAIEAEERRVQAEKAEVERKEKALAAAADAEVRRAAARSRADEARMRAEAARVAAAQENAFPALGSQQGRGREGQRERDGDGRRFDGRVVNDGARGGRSNGNGPRPYQQRFEGEQRPDMNGNFSGGRSRPPRVCRYFLTKRGCDRGMDCPFLHESNPVDQVAPAPQSPLPPSQPEKQETRKEVPAQVHEVAPVQKHQQPKRPAAPRNTNHPAVESHQTAQAPSSSAAAPVPNPRESPPRKEGKRSVSAAASTTVAKVESPVKSAAKVLYEEAPAATSVKSSQQPAQQPAPVKASPAPGSTKSTPTPPAAPKVTQQPPKVAAAPAVPVKAAPVPAVKSAPVPVPAKAAPATPAAPKPAQHSAPAVAPTKAVPSPVTPVKAVASPAAPVKATPPQQQSSAKPAPAQQQAPVKSGQTSSQNKPATVVANGKIPTAKPTQQQQQPATAKPTPGPAGKSAAPSAPVNEEKVAVVQAEPGKAEAAPRPTANGPSRRINRPCHFFNTQGGCREGDACPFLHVALPRRGGPSKPQTQNAEASAPVSTEKEKKMWADDVVGDDDASGGVAGEEGAGGEAAVPNGSGAKPSRPIKHRTPRQALSNFFYIHKISKPIVAKLKEAKGEMELTDLLTVTDAELEAAGCTIAGLRRKFISSAARFVARYQEEAEQFSQMKQEKLQQVLGGASGSGSVRAPAPAARGRAPGGRGRVAPAAEGSAAAPRANA